MNLSEKKIKTNEEKKQVQSKDKPSDDMVELQIEKNFFIKTTDHDRKRQEKWKIGKRNFS